MPKTSRHNLGIHERARFPWSLTLALLFFVTQAFAGGKSIQVNNVAHGTADITQSGATTTIRASNNAIINYNQFNVMVGEAVKFVQPTAQSRVLNRINSATPSQINGSVSANGIVYFVNPAGVMFGPNSIINVGQLYAAAGHISDSNFLGNINQFTGNQGWVINQGSIYANAVTLAGQHVANMGSIVAPEGLVTMVAGNDIFVGPQDGRIMVKVSKDAAETTAAASPNPGVENSGNISAPGGSVAIVAGDVYSLAIRHTGNTKAANVTLDGGKSGVVQASGKIDASNASGTGGTVQILGNKVALIGATIDASGSAGGGTVLVGGDTHGQGPVPTSSITYVSADSAITADARNSGSGGKVVIWSDELTMFYGNLYARGPGAGGFAEVSSGKILDFLPASIDLGGGTLLLDPDAIIVQDASPNIDGAGLGHDITAATDLNLTTNFAGVTSVITSTALNTILSTTPVVLAAVNSISVNTSAIHINVGNGVTLTFNAPTLNLNDSITLTGTGALAAGGTLSAVTVASPGSIQQGINLAPVSSTLNIAAGSYAETVAVNKNVTLLGPTVGTATATSWTTNLANTVGIGNNLGATGAITFNGPVTLATNTQLAAATLTLNNTITGAFNLGLNTPTINLNVPLPVAPTLTSNASTVNVNLNNLPVTPAGKIQDAVTLATPGATINLAAGSYAENVSINKNITLLGPTVGTAQATSWTTDIAATVTFGNHLDSTGDFTFNGPTLVPGSTSLTGSTLTINSILINSAILTLSFPTINLNGPLSNFGAINTNASTINVNLNNLPVNPPLGLINDALTLAPSGATINVAGGTYSEDVSVNKDVSILGPTSGIAQTNSWTTNALNTVIISGNLGAANEFQFNGPIVLAGNTQLTGNGVTINGAVSGAFVFTQFVPFINLNAPVNVGSFTGVPGTVNVNLNNLPALPAGRITDALNVATVGTTINLAAGNYAEVVSVNKDVTIVGPTLGAATATSWSLNSFNTVGLGGHLASGGSFDLGGPTFVVANTSLTAATTLTINGALTGSFALDISAPIVNLNAPITIGGPLTGTVPAVNVNLFNLPITPAGQIQNALDIAASGATVTLAAGSYSGAVSVDKDLTILGPTLGTATTTSWTTNVLNTVSIGNDLGASTFFRFNGPLTLVANTALTAGTAVTLSGTTIGAFNLALTAPIVNLNAPVNIGGTFSGNPTTVNVDLNNLPVTPAGRIQDALTVATTGATINIAAGSYAEAVSVDKNVTLLGPASGTATATSWTTNVANTPAIGNHLGATGAFLFNGPLSLAADTILTAGTTATFSGTVSGPFALTVNAPTVNLNAPINSTGTFSGTPTTVNVDLNNLPITPAGKIQNAISVAATSGATINITAGSYAEAVSVAKNVTLLGPTVGTATATSWSMNLANTVSLGNHLGATDRIALNGPILLAADTALSAVNSVTVNNTVTGAFNLVLTTPTVNLNAPITVTTLSGTPTTVNVNLNNLPASPAGQIQDAVDVAASGATIHLAAGTYAESVTVNKNVTLLGPTSGIATAADLTTNLANTVTLGNHLGATTTFLFNGPLVLAADTTLTAGTSVTFDGAVSGPFSLVVNTPTVDLNAPITVGGTLSGNPTTINIDLLNLPLSPAGRIQDAVSLAASVATFNLAAGTYAQAISINKNITLLGPTIGTATATSWTTNAGNTITVGNHLGATTFFLINGPMILAANTTFTAGTAITLNGNVTGPFNLFLDVPTLNLNAPVAIGGTLSGTATAVNVNLFNLPATLAGSIQDAVDAAAPGATVTLAAGTYTDAVTINKDLTIFGPTTGTALTTSWTANVANTLTLGNNLSATGAFTLDGPVLLAADTHLASTGAGNLLFGSTLDATGSAHALQLDTAGTTSFGSTIGNTLALASLTTDAPGSTLFSSTLVKTTGSQTFNDSVTVGPGSMTFLTTNGGSVVFGKTFDGGNNVTITSSFLGSVTFGGDVGSSIPLTSLAVTANFIGVNGSLVRSSGNQNYAGPVFVGGPASTFTSTTSGAITFAQTLDGVSAVTVNTTGATSFDGSVGSTTPLLSLTTDFPGTTAVNGGLIQTTGAQTYNDPVTLGAAPTLLVSTAAGNMHFAQSLDGASAVTLNSSGQKFFDGPVGSNTPLLSLHVNAAQTLTINGGLVKTTGDQVYSDFVVVQSPATEFTATGGGTIHFQQTLNGTSAVTVNTSGASVFGAVGGSIPLSSLATDSAGTTSIVGGLVSTAGAQTYGDPVALSSGTTSFISVNNITFAAALDGASNATFSTSGTTTFSAAVGQTTPLTSLTTDAPGIAAVNGALVRTTAGQTFNNPVTLGGSTSFFNSTGGGDIHFARTLDGASGVIVTSAGNKIFDGPVGGTTPLLSLHADSAQTITINGGLVKTVGAQLYDDPVVLGAAATEFTSTGGGDIHFVQTLDGASAVTINTSHVTTFGGAVGGTTPLTSLATDAPGSTTISGGLVTTTGAQIFADPLTLSNGTTSFNSTNGGSITFSQTLDGASATSVNTAGLTSFGGTVGQTTALTSLVTDSPGTTTFNTSLVKTSANQEFGDPVTIGSSTIAFDATSGGFITFSRSLDGSADVTLNTQGGMTFSGAVGGSIPLTSLVTGPLGSTVVAGGLVKTTGAQTYENAVHLGEAPTTFVVTGTGNITFAQSLDGASDTTIQTLGGGTTTFTGAVGSTIPLRSLTTDAPGTTIINGGLIATTGSQTYNDPITLGQNTALGASTSGLIYIANPVSNAVNLTVDTSLGTGSITFNGPINVNNLVITSGRDITLMGSVTAANEIFLLASIAAPRMTTTAGPGVETSGFINLYGNLIADHIELNIFGLPEVPSIASIIVRDPTLTTFTAPDGFAMGQNEKLTALGSLTINTGTATLSDMTVLGTLTVNASAINVLTRAPGQLQASLPNGSTGLDQDVTNDPTKVETVDFVAADLAFPASVVPVNIGGFTGAKYATPNGNGFVAGNAIRVFNKGSSTFGANLFTAADGTVFDLKAEGPANTSVSSALASALPQQLPMPNSVIGISTEDFETLLHAGVNARDVYTVEFVEGLIGRSLYNDIPTREGSIIPSAERQTIDYKVAVTRLNYYLVQDLIATYHEIFDTPVMKDGKPVYKDGRITYQDARKRPEMYRVFSATVALYQEDHPDEEFNPAGFAQYLDKTREEKTSAAALGYLDQLRTLLGRIRALGLTPKDYQVAKSRLLTGLARGLTATQLEQVIDLTRPTFKATTQGR